MSHFSVLVVGDNVEKQLQPYHQYECTGIDDEYVVWVDITDEAKKEHAADSEGRTFEQFLEYYYGFHRNDAFKKLEDGKFYSKTNPNYKWDCWKIGGRWHGWLGRIDQGVKADFDFEAKRESAMYEAFAKYREICPPVELQPAVPAWAEVQANKPEENQTEYFDEQRSIRDNDPWIKAVRQATGNPFIDEDSFRCTIEEYGQKAYDSAISPWAIVKDGEWIEKGEMGWFGMSSNETDQSVWNKKVAELLDELPPMTKLTVVDCHI